MYSVNVKVQCMHQQKCVWTSIDIAVVDASQGMENFPFSYSNWILLVSAFV